MEDKGKISDGYHTFNELYKHRSILFIAVCKSHSLFAWVSKKHSDGTMFDNMFILGINHAHGTQITYHLDMEYFEECLGFCDEIANAPVWDGHTSDDVLERLRNL